MYAADMWHLDMQDTTALNSSPLYNLLSLQTNTKNIIIPECPWEMK
jgi:hypothetical protein